MFNASKCPAEAIKQFNDVRWDIMLGDLGCTPADVPLFPDPKTMVGKFIEMRKRIGYTDERIETELRIIFPK